MPVTCIVVGCGSRLDRDRVGFYSVPTVLNHKFLTSKNELSRKRRALWLAAIKRDDLTDSKTKYQRVCSRHFLTGKPASLEDETNPDWVPSQNMGHSSENVVEKKARLDKRKMKLTRNDPQSEMDNDANEEGDGQETSTSIQTDLTMEELTLKFEQLRFVSQKMVKLEWQLANLAFGLMDKQSDDNKWKYYTGFDFKFVNSVIFMMVEKCTAATYTTALSPFNQLLLTLIKLRLDLHFKDLAYHFNISPTTASKYFENMIGILYKKFKPLIRWPDRSVCRSNIPLCFKESFHDKTTVIIDCFEIFIEKPASLLTRQQCWSRYKHHYTIKFLIGITPQGNIRYISDTWGGRATDKQIVEGSNFCDYIKPGDIVLADRGFLIQDTIGILRARLCIPVFTRGKDQLHPIEIEETRQIAHVRIHVERVIGLLKNKFTIFKGTIPITMVNRGTENISLLDKIVTVCSALVNISQPIIPL